MSDYIPFEIQVDIIKRLPVKSLIQFRSVSKAWKSLIDSSDFIYHYKSQQQHLFVRYVNYTPVYEREYFSFVDDDDIFPKRKVSFTPPALAKMFKNFPDIRGSSHGLLLLFGDHISRPGIFMTAIWNPSIRKAIGVVFALLPMVKLSLSFGVCNNDPKIVKITQRSIRSSDMGTIAEVFTLRTGAWRRPYGNLPRKSIEFELYSEVSVDGFVYWAATCNTIEGEYYNLIISFDMTSEEFREINLPSSLAHDMSSENVWISKLKNSLVVLIDDEVGMSFDLWTMEDAVSKSFKKLYTIRTSDVVFDEVLSELSLRVPNIIEYLCQQFEEDSSLAAYKPYSKQIDNLVITQSGSTDSLCVFPYIETLLLLDQPDSVIYEEGKHYNFKVES